MERAAIVLQARMGSTRLPGKVLARVAGRTIVEHCIERLRFSSGLPVVLATTTRSDDDCLEQTGHRLGVAVVRGPDEDVLARFVLAAKTHGLTEVIRATADNPCVDMDGPRRVLALLRRTRADYVVEHGSAHGAAVEAIATNALMRADEFAVDPEDREHVNPLIRRNSRFRTLVALPPADVRCPMLRVTVDTEEDLKFVRALFDRAEQLYDAPVSLKNLIATAAQLSALRHRIGAGVQGA